MIEKRQKQQLRDEAFDFLFPYRGQSDGISGFSGGVEFLPCLVPTCAEQLVQFFPENLAVMILQILVRYFEEEWSEYVH